MRLRPELVVVVVAITAVFALYRYERTFSSNRWQSANLMTQTRVHMAPDLLGSRQLIGKSRAEVIKLLGPTTETDKFRDWDMVYVLGPQEGYIDDQWLVLKLDESGRVTKQELVYD